jgi:hypothetical protein
LEFVVSYHPESLPWLAEIFGGFEGLNLYTFIIGFIATLGISLIAVANRWEVLYLTSLFFFGGMVILYLLTGYDAMIMPYIYISGILSVGFLYMTGFRVKDNGALGLAVFFTLAFVTVIIEEGLITRLVVIVYDIFIIIFSLGFFKPFKEELVA